MQNLPENLIPFASILRSDRKIIEGEELQRNFDSGKPWESMNADVYLDRLGYSGDEGLPAIIKCAYSEKEHTIYFNI